MINIYNQSPYHFLYAEKCQSPWLSYLQRILHKQMFVMHLLYVGVKLIMFSSWINKGYPDQHWGWKDTLLICRHLCASADMAYPPPHSPGTSCSDQWAQHCINARGNKLTKKTNYCHIKAFREPTQSTRNPFLCHICAGKGEGMEHGDITQHFYYNHKTPLFVILQSSRHPLR